ncbi:MAG TPA: YihY/virulence factor BrkB family protein [Polyangiaceae bacterium]|nr:YihY/virulence factor BrkB family protein [Polyangiaceae bacterium]
MLHADSHSKHSRRPRSTFPQRLGTIWQLFNQTLEEFSKARADLLAAALAFHALLSMAPLIIVAVAIAGLVLGEAAAHAEVTRLLEDTLGPKSAATVNSWVSEASESGGVASAVGVVLSLFAASRLGQTLHNALNQIDHIDVFMAEGFRSTVEHYVRRRVFAFGVVAASGPLLLLMVLSRTLLTGFHTRLFASMPWQGAIVQAAQLLISLFSVALTTALVLRYVPDTRVGWRNAWVGGLLTSVLFNIGNALVSWYLALASVTAAYGAAGSLVVVLLWLYFSAQIFLLGAGFTRAYAQRYGSALTELEEREVEQAEHIAEAARPSSE